MAQTKWRAKASNHDHFSGRAHVIRVQQWRQRHPRYWRKRRIGIIALPARLGLPRLLRAQVRYVALQDSIDTHFALKTALAIISRALRYKIH